MVRQNTIARLDRLTFTSTPADVARLVDEGRLTPVPGNADYRLKGVPLPFAHPVVRMFIERMARELRRDCGEQLVVTSLVRPMMHQPPNAHALSVHPAGMAVDLHIPDRPRCRRFLESALLALEEEGVLDATGERNPPHLHVAIYPRAYAMYLARIAQNPAWAAEAVRPGRARGPSAAIRPHWLFAGGLFIALASAVVVRLLVQGTTRPRRRNDDPEEPDRGE